nr:GNAT family N-acetyltransferase [Rhodobium orientis]
MAFCALTPGDTELLGISHLILDADREVGEYAVAVRSDLKGRGLGWLLMQKLIGFAASEGVKTIYGDVLAANTTMLQMCRELGFEVERHPQEAGVIRVTLQVSADRQRELAAGMA